MQSALATVSAPIRPLTTLSCLSMSSACADWRSVPNHTRVHGLRHLLVFEVQIGQRCAFNQQCIGGSSCEFDVCSCPPNTFDDGNGLCRSDGGPSGEQLCPLESDEAVYDTDYTEPINCRVKNCPAGSYCQLNQRLGQYFCCRPREDSGKSAEKCSNPSQSVIYKDGAPIDCLYSRCPANSHCEHSSTAQQYVCCG
uniref:EB domain-containing protein n=1 Tax=Angiostrongylus cantonensis TaxID=6313 RepID=A0A0K0D975_ANGCA